MSLDDVVLRRDTPEYRRKERKEELVGFGLAAVMLAAVVAGAPALLDAIIMPFGLLLLASWPASAVLFVFGFLASLGK